MQGVRDIRRAASAHHSAENEIRTIDHREKETASPPLDSQATEIAPTTP
jgi:hypothetical protein